jgi:hypothetical protein
VHASLFIVQRIPFPPVVVFACLANSKNDENPLMHFYVEASKQIQE